MVINIKSNKHYIFHYSSNARPVNSLSQERISLYALDGLSAEKLVVNQGRFDELKECLNHVEAGDVA